VTAPSVGGSPTVIALEEHWWPPELVAALERLPHGRRDEGLELFTGGERERRLADLGEERLRDMDTQGVDLAVISVTTPATQPLAPAEAVALAREANDQAAAAVAAHPDRLAAFATLPTPDPDAAAHELERSVTQLGFRGAMLHGRTGDRHLDDPALRGVFERAATLGVPIYLHPQMPSPEVRRLYYDGFGDVVSGYFASGGWGWHMETGIEAVRLILAGTFDRSPNLQLILGHWGEMVVYFLERLDVMSQVATHLDRGVADYVRENVAVTPSAMFDQRLLRRAIDVLGVDRILMSTDYPFQDAPKRNARAFLTNSALTIDEQERIGSRNATRLLGI
jgi:predicted TIM-barrel fold metal-dependent hydrolase